jgi:TolB-like protein
MTRPLAVAIALACLFAASPAAAEMRIAVMEFTSASKDPELEPLGKGLQSMVTTDLANVESIKVVERERLKDVENELKLSHGQGFDKATAAKIGKLSGATYLFVGSFTVVKEDMRLDGRLIAVGSGEVLLGEQIAGEKALFFELEQKLVQKVIGVLGVKLAPKEKAALARPHTADFQAFKKFSDGIKAFDDGRLDAAMKALGEATALDKDFKLAALTLEEYERLAEQVRAKAVAAGRVEDEVERLEKNKALAAEVRVVKQLWPILEQKGSSPDLKVKRVAAACVLANAYRDRFGFSRRGPVNSKDLAEAGFDDFSLDRTADGLFALAWSEAPDVFPRIPPLCVGFGVVSASNDRPIDMLLGYEIERAAKLSADTSTLLSYINNNATVDPAAEALGLDPPGEVRLWEKLYALSQKLPGITDADRARFEQTLAERRRRAGDLDGSTQMYALASRHTKDSYRLKQYAEEIDKNKKLKLLVPPGAPAELRELFLMNPEGYESQLERLSKPGQARKLTEAVESARDLSHREHVVFGDLQTWELIAPNFGARTRSGPRSSRIRTDELRYQGTKADPVLFVTGVRGRRLTVRASIDQAAPAAGLYPYEKAPPPGGGEVGVAFAISRPTPEGGIERGTPTITVAHAVLVGTDRVRLVQLRRDGEHNLEIKQLADAAIGGAGTGRRPLEVIVEPGKVTVSVGGKRATFPWKAEGAGDGFAGFLFTGAGYAAISQPSIKVVGAGR